MTMRPTGLLSAVMSKKTRGRPIFLAAASASVLTELTRLLRLVRAPTADCAACRFARLKVESIVSRRQIDANAMFP